MDDFANRTTLSLSISEDTKNDIEDEFTNELSPSAKENDDDDSWRLTLESYEDILQSVPVKDETFSYLSSVRKFVTFCKQLIDKQMPVFIRNNELPSVGVQIAIRVCAKFLLDHFEKSNREMYEKYDAIIRNMKLTLERFQFGVYAENANEYVNYMFWRYTLATPDWNRKNDSELQEVKDDISNWDVVKFLTNNKFPSPAWFKRFQESLENLNIDNIKILLNDGELSVSDLDFVKKLVENVLDWNF